MKIKSLDSIDFDTIFEAFKEAFADYEMQLNKIQLQTMLKRRGFNPDLSFAAFEENKIVAFTFNGIGNFNGIQTAYDTGTGTLKEYRGKGYATKVFEYSIPFLKENNIKQYLLEVLQHNTKAVSVYRNLGFETVREFNYFMQSNKDIHNNVKLSDNSFTIKQIDISKFCSIADFWDFHPSWQNSFESIQRVPEDFISFGAFVKDELVGYCVFEPVSGDVTQLAVSKQHRRKGIASLLLQEMIDLNRNKIMKVLNTDMLCGSITEFLKAKNIEIKGTQFEMIKVL